MDKRIEETKRIYEFDNKIDLKNSEKVKVKVLQYIDTYLYIDNFINGNSVEFLYSEILQKHFMICNEKWTEIKIEVFEHYKNNIYEMINNKKHIVLDFINVFSFTNKPEGPIYSYHHMVDGNDADNDNHFCITDDTNEELDDVLIELNVNKYSIYTNTLPVSSLEMFRKLIK